MRATIVSALFVATAIAGTACSSSTDTETGSSQDDVVALDACAGKSCGASCSLCNGRPGCVETAVLKQCNAEGKCTMHAPQCSVDAGRAPGDYEPCGDKACGDSCSICPPGDPDCFETAVLKFCQADGACDATEPVCTPPTKPYEPCGGKQCGDRCNICPPGDANCFETAVLKFCQPGGACQATLPQFCF
jgi:hypothetical protein